MSFDKDENGFMNDAYGLSLEEYKYFVRNCYRESKGVGLPSWKVPHTIYILMNGNCAVGIFKVRHYLNDTLKNGSGHVGFGICKEYRKQGLATKGLELILKEIRRYMLEDEIYMSVNKQNLASLKVQTKNGAYVHHEDEENYYTRIRK